jgi:tetratricopeptide (TPR) repeat protein
LHAQEETGNSVYALVIGVSKYSDPSFKPLNYADDDALWFQQFVKNKLSKPSDENKIKLFRNDSARADFIWAEILKIRKKVKAGDTVYFYFSGHGDASNPENIMLITHNAVNGVLQAGGCIAMRDLKDEIKILNAKGVKVFLITDACRSNENAYEWNQSLFTDKIANKSSGEFQFISCSSDEKSFEDVRWGGGHGVFTYHLIEGWIGLADEDDGWVSVGELVTYVKSKVKADTYDPQTKKTLQKPHYCCTDQEDWIVGKVDEEMKKRILVQKEMGNNQFAVLMPNMRTKDVDLTQVEDTLLLRYYQKFYFALGDKRYLYPAADCAYYYYSLLKNVPGATPLLEDVEIDLRASMANEAQYTLQKFLSGMDTTMAHTDFLNAAALMNSALAMTDTADQVYANMKARALFLEAGGLLHGQDNIVEAFYKLDSSLVYEKDAPYVYYMRAKIYEELTFRREAEENYLKAIALAPKWVFPLIELGYFYAETGEWDKSLLYYEKALAIKPRPHTYNLIAYSYHSKQVFDKALEAYEKGLALDPENPATLCGIASVMQSMGKMDSAYLYYLRALEKDSFNYYTYYNLGYYFYYQKMYANAIDFFAYSVSLNPTYQQGFLMLGAVYDLTNNPEKSIENYKECLRLDRFNTDVYIRLGNALLRQGLQEEALEFLKIPLYFDKKYNTKDLGEAFLNANMPDSAIKYLERSLSDFPGDYYTHTLLGSAYTNKKNFREALFQFQKSTSLKKEYTYNYYALGVCYFHLEKYDSAAFYYQTAIDYDPDYEEIYPYLWSVLFYELQQKEQALIVLEKARTQFADDSEMAYYLFYHHLETGNLEKAAYFSNVCLTLEPESPKYHYGKAMYLARTGKTDEAVNHLEKAVSLGMELTSDQLAVGYFDNLRNTKRFKKLVHSPR